MISVIIPNWNGEAILPTCLDSLRRQSYREFEIIVVDNASTDTSCQVVWERYPEVRLVELPANLGLTGGVNAGIRQARGEAIALLNNDTEAEPHWLEALTQALQEHPEAGSVASKILLFDRRHIIHSAGDYYRRDGIPGNRGVWQEDHGQYRPGWVFGGCGGAVVYRRSLLEDVGLLDEDYFMYSEEVDLCYRLRRAGWEVWWVPGARVLHYGGQSSSQASTAMFLQLYRSKYLFFKKAYGRPAALAFKLVLLGATLARLAVSPLALGLARPRRAQLLEKARLYRQLLVQLPGM